MSDTKTIVTKKEFEQLISMAMLYPTDDEKEKIRRQLSEALEAVEALNKLNTEGTDPLSNPTGIKNVTREDKIEPSLTQEQALSNAKRTHKGFFVTDAILEHK